MRFARHIYVYALGLWAGAAVFFGAVVAPGAFRVLERSGVPAPRSVAGDLVTYAVVRLQWSAALAVLLAMGCTVYLHRGGAGGRPATTWRMVSLSTMLAFVGWSGYFSSKMLSLRIRFQMPIDQLAADDALRTSFNSMHRASTVLFTAAIVAALVALAVRPSGPEAA